MENILIWILILCVVYVAIPKSNPRDDPLLRDHPVPHKRQGPKINHLVTDSAWADAFVSDMATQPGQVLTDEQVRQMYGEIVNDKSLSIDAKQVMLDGLSQRVENYHPEGMGAAVLDEISNESTALTHPNWHGRHGNWKSARGW